MRNTLLYLLFILPLGLSAQQNDAAVLLDKVIATMRSDAAVQFDYTYTVYDSDNSAVQSDKGVMRLDGDKYVLIMDGMKLWCNGVSQWSYMKDINEIYITDATSDEAQNLSPLYMMESYRAGCEKSLLMQGSLAVVTLKTDAGEGIEKVELYIDSNSNRLKAMYVYILSQGRVEIVLDKYTPGCKFPQECYECPVKEFPDAEIVDMR